MRRWLAYVAMVALAVGTAALVARAPELLSRMEVFRVTQLSLEGARYLTETEAVAAVALPPQASVWDDNDEWEARLEAHPLVKDARIRRRLPGTLVLEVQEREPVALFPSPTLEPVDEAGRILPIDPALHKLDLPIMVPGQEGGGVALTPAERRVLAGEIARLAHGDPGFLARISEVAMNRQGELRAQVWDPPVTLYFRPGLPSGRIQDGFRALDDARGRFDGSEVMDLDLRYEDQVVVRLSRARGN